MPPYVIGESEWDALDDWEFGRVVRDESEQEWLLGRVRALDEASAQAFAQAESADEKLDVLRDMLALPGIFKDHLRTEIFHAWEARKFTSDEREIDRLLAGERHRIEAALALRAIEENDGHEAAMIRYAELSVCEALLVNVVGSGDFRQVISDGQCDVSAAVRMTQDALRNIASPVLTEDYYRQWVEENA